MAKYIRIYTDEQLINCIRSKIRVEVWIGNEKDCVEPIINFNDYIIQTNSGSYIRNNLTLITSKNYFSCL